MEELIEIHSQDSAFPEILCSSIGKSSLQFFVRKVQDRIILSRLRRLVVKNATKSRYSLQCLYRDETIVVYIAGGIDAFIKLTRDWSLFGSPLKLIPLELTSHEGDFIKFPLQS